MPVTLKQLEAFFQAARLGTFSIAAERLHVTQSSLSKRIAELEAVIGKPLFDRTGKRATLTDDGEQLIPLVQQVLELAQRIGEPAPGDLRLAGNCRFGITELVSNTWLPAFIERVRREFPEVSPKPQVGLGRTLEQLVGRGELDFAVIAGEPQMDGTAFETVAEVPFAWMAAPSRLRGRKPKLSAQTFEDNPVITLPTESGQHGTIERWMTAHGFKVHDTIACNSLTAIIGLTASGLGVSVLPPCVAPLVKKRVLVALASELPLPLVPYTIIWRRDDLRGLVREMKRIVREEADFTKANVLW